MPARPDTCCRVPTPSRHSILRSIPRNMGLPDTACIAFRLSQAVYRPLFELVWGAGSLDIKFPNNTEKICSTPGGAASLGQEAGGSPTPIALSPADRTKANRVYDNWGQSISFYEASPRISAFSSKFDAFLSGTYTLTAEEQAGYDLFRGKAGCNTCHLDGRGSTQNGGTDTSAAADVTPLFTCFGYANLGLPLNPRDGYLLSDHAGSLRVYAQSLRLRLQRFGIGHVPQKRPRLRPQSERGLDTLAPRSTARCR